LKDDPALLVGVDRPLHACHFITPLGGLGYFPSSFLVFLVSAGASVRSLLSRRVRRLDLCSSRWFMLARRRITLPVAVNRNRFAAPLCVFIFGMVAVVSVVRLRASRHDCLRAVRHLSCGVLMARLIPRSSGAGGDARAQPPAPSPGSALRAPAPGWLPSGWPTGCWLALGWLALGLGWRAWCGGALGRRGRATGASPAAAAASREAVRSAFDSLFFRCGPITMIMFRPSCLGWASTKPSSSTSPARRCSSRKPSSGRDCSRPRNMMVTLTLSPCLRNRST